MSNSIGRPQKPKVFEMDVEISTKVADVGAYTLEETHSGMRYHGSTGNLYRRVIEHQKSLKNGDHYNENLQQLHSSGKKIKLTFHPTETIRKSALGRSKGQVVVDGVVFDSVCEAARALRVGHRTVRKRCASDDFGTWVHIPKKTREVL